LNLFDFTLQLKGYPIKKAKKDLERIKNLSEIDYQNYLNYRKQNILKYHLKHNSFYKNFTKNLDTSNWNSLPILKKSDCQIPLSERLSDGFSLKNTHIHKTSGSSGTPLIFAKDKYTHALTWANFLDKYAQFGIYSNSKQARFYGIPLSGMPYYKERVKDFLANRYRFSAFDLTTEQFEQNIEKFKTTAFQYVNGYTSVIVQFAKYLRTKRLILKDICPSLKICIVTAEMLFKSDKMLLETQFDIPVINEYGSAELGLISFNNIKNEWIVNGEDLFVEILDENDQHIPFEEEGRLIITSLYNKAHPFIRYEIGDIGAFTKSRSNKSRKLKTLKGRTSDIIKLPSGKKSAGLTFYYITKTIIDNNTDVKEFIIEQHKINEFLILYKSDKELIKSKIDLIHNEVEKYLESNLNVFFKRKDNLNRSKNGKLKQFTSFLE